MKFRFLLFRGLLFLVFEPAKKFVPLQYVRWCFLASFSHSETLLACFLAVRLAWVERLLGLS